MADTRLRQIFIKTGVVKRYAKEKVSYEKEAENEQKRILKFRAENRDEHDIRKQEEVIQENLMMIPECQRRLKTAYEELSEMLKNEKDLEEKDEYIKAVAALKESKLQLQ
ncbi:CLUMA_CG012474, isoform A [Clunio marinus]|uniref:Tubulin-specific chaperone A n=1 Tax=Clunio marinus TaxID=568069 RepID=A0A1J1IG30_9DIPT|nr:CLUMA_CG012474, isoform A [Clunio marinus]